MNKNESEFLRYIDSEIAWHDKKAVELKRRRVWARMLIIVFSTSITILAVVGSKFLQIQKTAVIITAVLANITTILESAIQVNQYELWVQYRQTAESLKWEKVNYLSEVGDYDEQAAGDTISLFAKNCGKILSTTNKQWVDSSRQAAQARD